MGPADAQIGLVDEPSALVWLVGFVGSAFLTAAAAFEGSAAALMGMADGHIAFLGLPAFLPRGHSVRQEWACSSMTISWAGASIAFVFSAGMSLEAEGSGSALLLLLLLRLRRSHFWLRSMESFWGATILAFSAFRVRSCTSQQLL